MGIFQTIHGEMRWLVLILGLVIIVRFGWRLMGKRPFHSPDRALMGAFTGLMDLNVTLGIILLLWKGVVEGAFHRYRLEHGFMMFIALVVLHGTAKWRKEGDDAAKYRNNLGIVVVTLLIVVIGVVRLINGWL